MRRLAGQAGRACLHGLHVAATVALTMALVGGLALGALAWRLGQGPVALPWLRGRMVAMANRSLAPGTVRIGAVALGWEGFHGGLGLPLALVLRDVTLTDAAGVNRVSLPRADVALSVPALLHLRLAPRAVLLDRARVVLRRQRDGALDVGFGASARAATPGGLLAPLLAALARPPAAIAGPTRFGPLSQLRLVLIRDATVLLIDDASGSLWRAPGSALTLRRGADGGVRAEAALAVPLAGQQVRLALNADLPAGGTEAQVTARLAPVVPAALARAAPLLAPLRAIAAPVGGEVRFRIGADGHPRQARLALTVGAGSLRLAGGSVPILGGALRAGLAGGTITVDALRLRLPAIDQPAPTTLILRGSLGHSSAGGSLLGRSLRGRSGSGWVAAFALGFDRVQFAALPRLWPPGLAADARGWLLKNIPRGTAADGAFSFGLSAGPGFAHPRLFQAAGQLSGSELEVHWLRPIPPLVDGTALLRMVKPDVMDIGVQGGRQTMAPGAPEGLVVRSGRVRIDGLTHHDQFAHITAEIGGPVAAAVALLKLPKLRLLARHPLPLHDPAGTVSVRLQVFVPLEKHLRLSEVRAAARASITGLHLARVAAGRDLDQGQVGLVVGMDGLTLAGQGKWAGIPVSLRGQMIFHPGTGGVSQVLTARGEADAAALAAAGWALPRGLLGGTAAISAVVTERQGGTGDVALRADLAAARLHLAVLDWNKPAGAPAVLTADLPLIHDRLVGAAPVTATGAGLDASGALEFAAGTLRRVRMSRLAVGGSALTLDVGLPAAGPIAVTLGGTVLDLSPRLGKAAKPSRPKAPPARGPAWTLAAKLARVRLAGGEALTAVRVRGADDGLIWTRLAVTAAEPGGKPLALSLTPAAAGRSLTLDAGDAGVLARGLGLPVRISGGVLHVVGTYGGGATAPLRGTATVSDFRLRDAPAVARVMQALTLYGLVELLQGPGLGVSRLVAPFELGGGRLVLHGARAFSPSLGATADGTVDLDTHRLDLSGTIVPAYFFNSLLGRLPIVGRLFSPEKGGGLFAADYTLRGPTAAPSVTVNPLAALTPGFLRNVFGLF